MSITIERNALFVTRFGANNEVMLKPGTNVLEDSEYALIESDDKFIESVERGDNDVMESASEGEESPAPVAKSRKRRAA